MASSGGYGWPRSPPLAPDTSSPIYPDRPIRPLPKRRIRDRLSSEYADQLSSPPQPPSSQLFTFPYPQDREQEARYQDHGGDGYNCTRCVDQEESDVDSDDEAIHGSYRSFNGQHGVGREGTPSQQPRNPPAPDSTASSGDGYESFENTNNKKKRKIPQSNGLLGSGHLSAASPDSGNLGSDGRELDAPPFSDGLSGAGTYYGSGAAAMASVGSGNPLAGAGRGRHSKNRSPMERRPLTNVTNNANATSPSVGRLRASTVSGTKGSAAPPQGIISAAIANAAQHSPSSARHGNENAGLSQHQVNRTPPPKTEFTFQSDASKGLSWPGAHHADMPPYPPVQPRYNNNSMPNRNAGHHTTAGAPQYPPAPQPQAAAPPPEPPRRKPRRPGKIYELAARQRRVQQEYQNYNNPPRREEIWVCEFCEYEDIFGTPPLALIREYERKDRIERKRIAEKRRLLEKAKAKGRRGRKGTKSKQNQPPASAAPVNHHANNSHLPPNDPRYDPPADLDYGDEEEEYYEDDYNDEDLPPGLEGEEQYEDSLDGDDGLLGRPMPGSFHGRGGGGGVRRPYPVPEATAGARFEEVSKRQRGMAASV